MGEASPVVGAVGTGVGAEVEVFGVIAGVVAVGVVVSGGDGSTVGAVVEVEAGAELGSAVGVGVGVGDGSAVGVGTGTGTGGGGASSVTVPIDIEEGTYEVTLNHSTTWTLASITCPTISYCPGAMSPGNDRPTI